MSIQRIINDIIKKEGGYVNHPDDRGGPTNFGITLKLYQKYNPFATITDLQRLTEADAYSIYEKEFYIMTRIDAVFALAPLVAEELLDTAVNMGPSVAIKFLQRVLNAYNLKQTVYPDLRVDGNIGNATLAALDSCLRYRGASKAELSIVKAMNCLQGARYIELAERREHDESFVYGWINNRIHL